jgi:hypothetical protein
LIYSCLEVVANFNPPLSILLPPSSSGPRWELSDKMAPCDWTLSATHLHREPDVSRRVVAFFSRFHNPASSLYLFIFSTPSRLHLRSHGWPNCVGVPPLQATKLLTTTSTMTTMTSNMSLPLHLVPDMDKTAPPEPGRTMSAPEIARIHKWQAGIEPGERATSSTQKFP